jgi:phosphopantetheinyl transferase
MVHGNSWRRYQSEVGRTILHALLLVTSDWPRIEVTKRESGQPVSSDGRSVSISHCDQYVCCAVAQHGLVGIDVELPKSCRNTKKIADSYFTSDEARWLSAQPAERFYQLWVLKEAWLKSAGVGLSGGLDRLNCTIEGDVIHAQAGEGSQSALKLLQLDGAFIGLSSSDTESLQLSLLRWSPVTREFCKDPQVRQLATSPVTDAVMCQKDPQECRN